MLLFILQRNKEIKTTDDILKDRYDIVFKQLFSLNLPIDANLSIVIKVQHFYDFTILLLRPQI